MERAIGGGSVEARPSLPPELDHPFRIIAFDWDGTAVESRRSDAARVSERLDRLLGAGARIGVITGTSFTNVERQIHGHIRPEHARRLLLMTNRGSEVFGFDRRGRPVLLFDRVATPEEERLLDRAAREVEERLVRLTGLRFELVMNRKNRRKIDLIPEPEWSDPPKSAIGALLAATEARLRGAGLRDGLREAFELTVRVAHEVGLEHARVTSDVKHIEVGLTDKSDSVAWLYREIARPLRVPPDEVLLLGDEFGPIAGFEGSDHRMLGVPELEGAVVVSVGPEPGGAPPSVIHLGGGPERFLEIMSAQLSIEERLGAFASPRDPAWAIDEPGFDIAREHEIESILSFANGYVGSRGSLAEGSSVSRPATFLAGAYEQSTDASPVPELLIVPDWGRLRFVIEGEPFAVEKGHTLHHRRVLDMRRGLLLRECKEQSPSGRVTLLRTVQAASLADRHLFLEAVSLSPQNFTGTVRIDAVLGGEVKSASGAQHWDSFEPQICPRGAMLAGRTESGLIAALASHLEVGDAVGAEVHRHEGPSWAAERCDLPVRLAQDHRLYRTVALFTSRDTARPRDAARALRASVAAEPVAHLVERHAEAWSERWRRADVTIDGAPEIERALRFAVYHLIAAANPEDARCSIGARSLSGEAYRGHVFWDTEIFMLPFFTHAYPEAARAMLGYRYRTLPGARRKALALGYEGAAYAWESAETGDETTPAAVISPYGELIRVLSGELEHHISADVAYALCTHVRATGDVELLRGAGLTILVETARFWASRVRLGDDGLFHIYGVIGPDEYHENVDDNAFTNWMARFNLRAAAEAAEAAPVPAGALGVTAEEIARFRSIARAMYLGQDPVSGLIEQHAGWHELAEVDLAPLFAERHAPIDMILGRARIQASQVVKQADVVQLVALLWDELSPEARLVNFLHYEPRTAHGSSLSPGAHALVATRLGLFETAAHYLAQTAAIDLGNTMGNSAGGVHAAAMGSLWQAVVLGAGGVRAAPDHDEALLIEPMLLPGWRHLGFPLAWRGRQLEIHLEPAAIEIACEGAAPLPIRARAPAGSPREIMAEPGRRYAASIREGEIGEWEEIAS